ncbi:hypothetical protein SynBIOSU31_01149 [Synechococcus sp. BIOS-U3-1]|nr:hypothetical protein SynBIOSU31_01149 [Synechococcus sp. BIOS-U3-1]
MSSVPASSSGWKIVITRADDLASTAVLIGPLSATHRHRETIRTL